MPEMLQHAEACKKAGCSRRLGVAALQQASELTCLIAHQVIFRPLRALSPSFPRVVLIAPLLEASPDPRSHVRYGWGQTAGSRLGVYGGAPVVASVEQILVDRAAVELRLHVPFPPDAHPSKLNRALSSPSSTPPSVALPWSDLSSHLMAAPKCLCALPLTILTTTKNSVSIT